MTSFTEHDFNIHSGPRKSGEFLLTATDGAAYRQLHARPRFPEIPSKGLDALGITQRKLNGNFNSWMDELSDRDKQEGGLWYPAGNDWGHHMAALHGQHPDKLFGVMSKMSPQRDWYANLDDAHNVASNHRDNPGAIVRPGGISGTDNLKQSLRVMGAADDPDSIHQAFLGTKNVGGRAVPRQPKDLPKTHDFFTALRDPEAGGAGNHSAQPAVADSWMSRSMLWSKKKWDEAQNGGKPLTWPGQGTGEGLDKHLPVKKPHPETGKWEVVGSKPPTARDVAARVVGLGGGYDRMRQAMQQGAARHDMPFAHGAQAAVWKSISGNANPDPNPQYGDLSEIEHDPRGLWNEQWARRASGLAVPAHNLDRSARLAAHGSAFDPDGPEDALPLEGWGGPEDISAIMRHVAARPGWDHWEDRPLISLAAPAPGDTGLERHERQRMGPHPGPIEAAYDRPDWEQDPESLTYQDHGHSTKPDPGGWGSVPDMLVRNKLKNTEEYRLPDEGLPTKARMSWYTDAAVDPERDNQQWDWAKGKWVPKPAGGETIPPARNNEFDHDRDWEGWQKRAFDWKPDHDEVQDDNGEWVPDTATPAGAFHAPMENGHSLSVWQHQPGEADAGMWAGGITHGDRYQGGDPKKYWTNVKNPDHPHGRFPTKEHAQQAVQQRYEQDYPTTGPGTGGHDSGIDYSDLNSFRDAPPPRRQASWYLPFDAGQREAGLSWYLAADDGLDSTPDDLKKKKPIGGGGLGVLPGMNDNLPDTSKAALPHWNSGGSSGGSSPSTGGSAPSGTPSNYNPSSGVSQWKTQVDTGLQRNGLPLSLENQVLHQMETESSGNPNAINRTDSNAQAGHPSQGLLQTIPSTFEKYRPATDPDNILDPQANVDAAIGYAKDTYGPSLMNSQGNGMGSGHGY